MNGLDLFSGIGGFTLGLEQAGMRTVAFCEIEPFCQAVLQKHWPDVPIYGDIRKLDGTGYRGKVDLICGGYPCQPFSLAGSRRGTADERHLWPEMLRLIREIRPRWVVAENVTGHVGLGFDEVAASLEAEGFTVWPFLIPASAVNAAHKRERLWIIAHADSQRLQGGDGPLSEDQGRRNRIPPLLPAFSSRASLWNELSASMLCGRADGISYRAHRLRALGNAVVPQIPAMIGKAIIKYDLDPPKIRGQWCSV